MPKHRIYSQLYLWLAERLYHEFAWAYDLVSWLVSAGMWSSWRAQALAYVVGNKVLEIGFGTGELLISLYKAGYVIYGLDNSTAMLNITTTKFKKREISTIPRIYGIAQQLPFPENTFDTVISTFPSNYIYDPKTMAEVRRILVSGTLNEQEFSGRFIIVGLLYNQQRMARGWVNQERLLDPAVRAKWAPGWEVEIIQPDPVEKTLPVVIMNKQPD